MRPSDRVRHSEQGLTLLELLVVLGILAATVLITAPMFGKVIGNGADRAAIERLQRGLEHARRVAVRSGQETVFVLNVESGEYGLGGQDYSGRLPDAWAIRTESALVERLDHNLIGIRYWPNGASTGGDIVLSSEETVYHVQIDWVTGRSHRTSEAIS